MESVLSKACGFDYLISCYQFFLRSIQYTHEKDVSDTLAKLPIWNVNPGDSLRFGLHDCVDEEKPTAN